MLPDFLKDFLLLEAQKQPLKHLKPAHEQLSLNYRDQSGQSGVRLNTQADRQVYRLSRLPAIYAVIEALAKELQAQLPDFAPTSLLDLGAGPGTVSLALAQHFASLEQIFLCERDREQVRWGQQLFGASGNPLLEAARWDIADLLSLQRWPQADLHCLSYVLNELDPSSQTQLLGKMYQQPFQVLLLVEPGTPLGYKHILAARKLALESGLQLLGPCPHAQACPLQAGDWCHFGTRVARTQVQRYLKDGFESYEDEKFAWLAVSKTPLLQSPAARVLRRPVYRKGVVDLTLCQSDGSWKTSSIARSHALYKKARKVDWGGSLS
ncbi:MAG: small ribosomal subunit Rsm22 family protein [Candidatus Sericytochromatia bacterium]